MDLAFMAEQRAFRDDVRAWLEAHATWDSDSGPARYDDLAEEVEALRAWQAELAAGGWIGVAWPTEYGGRGVGAVEHYIVQEELARARAPELVGRIGVNLAGPTLLAHGTAHQRARWLPSILDASQLWCQLFSEPGAGSDLAAVATRAVRVDGGWELTGQKVWTSYAQFADWGICLARTDPDAPRHRGISYFAVDMRQPGVVVRPLVQITGEAEFNEVFLDAAFVADDQLIGVENDGWNVASSTLSHERGTSPRQLVKHIQLVDDLLRMVIESDLVEEPRLRQRVAQAYMDVRVFQLHNWRSLSRLERGLDPGPEGSLLKLYWSEMTQCLHDTVMAALGPAAPLWRGAEGNPGDGRWQRSFLYYRSARIFAGTNEIQRNIVGERVLGLPREPRQKQETR